MDTIRKAARQIIDLLNDGSPVVSKEDWLNDHPAAHFRTEDDYYAAHGEKAIMDIIRGVFTIEY